MLKNHNITKMNNLIIFFSFYLSIYLCLLNHYLRNTCFQIFNKGYTIMQDDYAFMNHYLWNTHVQHCNNGPQGALTINTCLITVKGCQAWLRWWLELPPLSLPASHTCTPSYHYPQLNSSGLLSTHYQIAVDFTVRSIADILVSLSVTFWSFSVLTLAFLDLSSVGFLPKP